MHGAAEGQVLTGAVCEVRGTGGRGGGIQVLVLMSDTGPGMGNVWGAMTPFLPVS